MFESEDWTSFFQEDVVLLHCRGCPAGGVFLHLCVRVYECVSMYMCGACDSLRRSDHRGRPAVHLLLQLHHLLYVSGLRGERKREQFRQM